MHANGEGRRAHGLSATNISSYHHYKCDLFLHNSYYGRQSNLNKDGAERSEIVKAQLKRGNDWESQLFSWLDEQDLLARVYSSILDAADIQTVIELDERDHFYVTGLHFYPPVEAFKHEYEKNGTQMPQFSIAKPDLLEIKRSEDGLIYWQILDAKSSLNIKTSHHAQIYFYHRCMEHFLPTSRFVSMGTVSIWLLKPSEAGIFEPSFEDIRSYPTSLLVPILDKFLFRQLPTILAQSHGDVKWHYNPVCRGCPFEYSCRTRTLEDHELGAMANISIQDAEVLRTILELERPANAFDRLSDIEDLDLIVRSKRTVTKLRGSHPSTIRRAQKILALPTRTSSRIQDSPVTAAALLGNVQVIRRRSYTFPKSEDIAVVISLVKDPSTFSPVAFCISVHTNYKIQKIPTMLTGKIDHFIPRLAYVLKTILNLQGMRDPPLRTQCYVFMPNEREELQKHLINAALTSDVSDISFQECLKLCIGAVCEGASLLSTAFQPLILSGALLDFLSKGGQRTDTELRMCLERLGLPKYGTVPEMLSRINAEISRLKAEGNRITTSADEAKDTKRAELGLLPRIVVVKRELQQLFALPIPGYWDLPESFSILCPGLAKTVECPTDEQLFTDFLAGRKEDFEKGIQLRNSCTYNIIKEMRHRINSTPKKLNDLLVNEARVLTSNFMDICVQDHLRKLFNMHQFEILAKLTTIWQNRIEGCPDSPILEFQGSGRHSDGSFVHKFIIRSGVFELSVDKDRSFYDYILTEDVMSIYGDHESIPVEAFFDDLAVSNVVFPLNKHTKPKWQSQPKIVQCNLLVADVADMVLQGDKTIMALRTYGNSECGFQQGKAYRLSPRLVDFNLIKILSTLLELDLQVSTRLDDGFSILSPFLQLCIDPHEFSQTLNISRQVSASYLKTENKINGLFRELQSLDIEPAQSLVLKPSQRRATRRILSNRLSVIWGPPGTGKTYTLSLSVLRLLEVRSRHKESTSQIILLSAMTHAAIHACLGKLEYLRSCYRQIPNLSIEWLDRISIEHVTRGLTHPKPHPDQTYVYAGTVFQLYSFCKRFGLQSDCVIIDEAGQLGVGLASLVLRSLKEDGRVIVAGDNEQLAPIFSAEYPVLESRLFGSILDCLMRLSSQTSGDDAKGSFSSSFEEESQISTVVQLTENFRLNEDLGEFVSTIYKKKFKPQKSQAKKVAVSLHSLDAYDYTNHLEKESCAYLVALSKAMLGLPQILLHPPKHKLTIMEDDIGYRPISLSLLRTNITTTNPNQALSYEEHVRCEASLAASIVKLIHRASPGESIFVATPHRLQRHAVKEALRSRPSDIIEAFGTLRLSSPSPGPAAEEQVDNSLIKVDTIERLQGSEAAFVICLFSYPSSPDRAGGVHFLLQRRRLNVAISRARTLCIMITSDALLNPGPGVFANAESVKGYTFLKAFENRAWTGSIDVNFDDL